MMITKTLILPCASIMKWTEFDAGADVLKGIG